MRIAILIALVFDGLAIGGERPPVLVGNQVATMDVPPVATMEEPPVRFDFSALDRPVRPDPRVAAYLAQPLNVGRCPCGATGFGCHCQPASACGREPCALHNPLLGAIIIASPKRKPDGTLATAGETATLIPSVDGVYRGPWDDPPRATFQQSCPNGNCPQSFGGGRRFRIFR